MQPWVWVVIAIAAVLFLFLLFRPGRGVGARRVVVNRRVAGGPRRPLLARPWGRRQAARRW
jgi:hypothetical protein